MEYPPPLLALADSQPYPLLFATVSGAHLYGFPSPDSDYDLRGVHLLPLASIVGLDKGPETIEKSTVVDGLELDLVTHDIGMFCDMLLRKNGLVLENIVSPLVVRTSPAHKELRALVPRLVTRHHAYHYLGLAASRWKAFAESEQHKVKPLLYAFRGLLTGLYLLETGAVEANLVHLNEHFRLPYLSELIAQKVEGEERGVLRDGDMAMIEREYLRLRADLERQHAASALPERSDARADLHALLVRLRMDAR